MVANEGFGLINICKLLLYREENGIIRTLYNHTYTSMCVSAQVILGLNDAMLRSDGQAVGRPGELKSQFTI